jgi:hypothetical protein
MSHSKAVIEKALDLAIEESTDSECPREWYDDFDWESCRTCIHDCELYEDRERDLKCWKRYYLEKANLTILTTSCTQ